MEMVRMEMVLRDYQQEMLSRLLAAWKRHRSVMVQMPTGTGKTVLLAKAIGLCAVGEKESVLIVAHRRELLDQIRATIKALGISDGSVRVESIQKLSKDSSASAFAPSLVIIDEAHHALAKTYRVLWERWPKAKFLGLTATPCRLSGQGFAGLFDVLLQSWPIQKFIDEGWLSDFEYVSARPDSMALKKVRLLKKRGADGDYQAKEMATVMDVPESVAHLYETYRQFAEGKKGIVYAIDRQHARHIADYYCEKGVRCCVIDAKTPARERKEKIDEYRLGQTDVLVNVDIFSEGYDCPEVEFIQLARPTLSLSKYLQQVGRGMRVSAGKPHVLIIDNVGQYQTFGLPTVERDWRRTFVGEETGRGVAGLTRCVVVDDERQEKELLNLEMVRIKKSGQKHTGLEVFLQDGRYGVLCNGKVACPAKFRNIERLPKDSGYFALGMYKRPSRREPGRIVDVTTVIDRKGQDLNIQLYGVVTWRNGFFYGEMKSGYHRYENCWDPVGNSYYDTSPEFHHVAGVEVGLGYEHNPPYDPCMKLRISTGKVSPRFYEGEMFYNRHIIIARDYLIVKRDHNHSYRICGYLGDSVLVQSEEGQGYQQIFHDGKMGGSFRSVPQGTSRLMKLEQLGLQRVKSVR